MTKPEKDEVLNPSEADTSAESSSPSSVDSGATPKASVDSQESAEAENETSEGEVLQAEIIEEAVAAAEEVAKAKAEVEEWRDKYMRLHAEWDTYRRRTSEQREAEKARAAEKLVMGLLPIIDDFDRTIDYAEKNGEAGMLDGVKVVRTKFLGVLEKDGVEAINPKGAAFDALEAQVVAMVDDPSVPDETVAEVFQLGYRMGSKVLRPATVTVATGGPKRETPEEGDKQ